MFLRTLVFCYVHTKQNPKRTERNKSSKLRAKQIVQLWFKFTCWIHRFHIGFIFRVISAWAHLSSRSSIISSSNSSSNNSSNSWQHCCNSNCNNPVWWISLTLVCWKPWGYRYDFVSLQWVSGQICASIDLTNGHEMTQFPLFLQDPSLLAGAQYKSDLLSPTGSGVKWNSLNGFFGTDTQNPYSIERAAKMYRNAAGRHSRIHESGRVPSKLNLQTRNTVKDSWCSSFHYQTAICDAAYTWNGQLPPRVQKNPTYSCKVFLGGVPWDITEGRRYFVFQPRKDTTVILSLGSDMQAAALSITCVHYFSSWVAERVQGFWANEDWMARQRRKASQVPSPRWVAIQQRTIVQCPLRGPRTSLLFAKLMYFFHSFMPASVYMLLRFSHKLAFFSAGYVYVLFECESSVKTLLQSCAMHSERDYNIPTGGEYYFKISSRRMRSKEVGWHWKLDPSCLLQCGKITVNWHAESALSQCWGNIGLVIGFDH